MNSNKLIITLLFPLLLIAPLLAQESDAELQQTFQQKRQYKRDVYQRTLDYIEENPDTPQLAKLYFNLAELSAEVDIFEPWKTAGFYEKVLASDPDFLQKDIVLYNIGFYNYKAILTRRDAARIENIDLVMNWPDSLRLGKAELARVISAYEEVLLEMPDSPYNTDAAYRLGRVYFDLAVDARIAKPYFDQAIYYFDIVAQREGDPLQYYGLFQRGWTYFASARFTKAIEDFSAILGILERAGESEKSTFFQADAIENIAFSLIEYDGTDFVGYSRAAQAAAEILKSSVADDYGQQILIKAVELKKTYNAPMQAVDLYKTYLLLYPDSRISPSLVDSIITIYQQNPQRVRQDQDPQELIIEQMHRLVTDFTIESDWYKKNQAQDITDQLEIIQAAYAFLEPKYLNNFLRTRQHSDYLNYEELVINYTAYPEFSDPQSVQRKKRMRKNIVDLSQDLAEITENPAHYFDTINEIDSYIEKQPVSAGLYHYYEQRFYNYEKLYDLLLPVVETEKYIAEERGLEIDRAGLDSLLIAASTQYRDFLVEYEKTNPDIYQQLIKVTYFRAELYYEDGRFAAAYNDYKDLLTYPLQDELKMITFSRLAEISQLQQRYDDAEYYFREASKYAVDENTDNFENNILAALLARARAYEAASDYRQAAQQYLKIASEFEAEKPEESVSFKLEAIKNLKKAGENQKAIDLYLEIASTRQSSSEVLSAYHGAWSISDSLHYWQQSVDLRRKFIQLYPQTNQAYKLRLQIIGFYEGEKFDNKRQAAQLLEELHADVGRIDMGGENPANILLHAIKLYQEIGDEAKVTALSLQFEKLYPQHERANDLLIAVAKKFKDEGRTAEYEQVAAKLYSKNPDLDLLLEVAVNKLKNIKEEADKLFEEKKYDQVMTKIEEFYEEESTYFQQGLELPTEHIHETFDYYKSFINFFVKYENALRSARNEIIDKTPDELIKVNSLTRWKDHLAEGESRIPKLMQKCDEVRDTFIELIQEGNNFNLETIRRTQALYTIARCYDYSADVVIDQVQTYLDISNQINNEQMKSNPVQQQQFKTALKNNSLQLANEFRKKAVQIYQTLLKTFSDDKDYSDKWTELSLTRLIQLGVRPDPSQQKEVIAVKEEPRDSVVVERQDQGQGQGREREMIVTDETWLAAGSAIRYDQARTSKTLKEFMQSLVWLPVGQANFQYFQKQMYGLEESPAEEIWFAELDTINVDIVYFRKLFILPDQFEDAVLKVFGQHMITLWVNGKNLLDAQGIVYDNKLKKVQVQTLQLSNLKPGENEVVIEVIGADYYKGLIAELSYKKGEQK
ncbi:MAG: hypothetical protein K9N09_08860 [Candidatus Cloacimonetes bacterium]|nr:hypothetical protein [Candidatus Cloacimonadota bacterium]MCF7814446.1 hypothetical protein [Candidatus Cloacimonadota bacterium]MCF7868796.1 hypothetical protein [Candidatus Cloacimonadota bacterium]